MAVGSKRRPYCGNEHVRELELRPLFLTLLTAVLAGATTLLIGAVAVIDFAYRSPSLHVALETAVAVISVVAAHLVYGRFRQSSARSDLLLFYSLAAFAVTNIVFSALPAALTRHYPDGVGTWAPAVGILVAVGLLVASAAASNRPVHRPFWDRVDRIGAALVVVALAAAFVLLATVEGPAPAEAFAPASWSWADFTGHPEVGLQIFISLGFLTAGFGFARRAEKTGDELMVWLAVGSVLATFARVNYFIFPSLYSNWVYAGDVLRLCFYLALFAGAAREIRAYQTRAADAAVLEERQRMARELHDGLAQELAFIASQTKKLADLTAETVGEGIPIAHLATAAERALDESRRAIAALSQPVLEPFHVVLAKEAHEIASRMNAEVELDLAADLDLDPATQEMLLRIAREAVGNAARHGHAHKILVQLSNGSGLHLRIVDDGIGFNSAALTEGRFGLASMKQRADLVGADFRLISRPGGGTEVSVVLR
jgi:signal transduction histidine kinase